MRKIGGRFPGKAIFLSRFYIVKVFKLPPLWARMNANSGLLATGFLKSTVSRLGHRRDSPNACIICKLSPGLLSNAFGGQAGTATREKGASHGELSSEAGRAVRRHRETSKILASRGLLSRAHIAGRIGTGAGPMHTATSECLGHR